MECKTLVKQMVGSVTVPKLIEMVSTLVSTQLNNKVIIVILNNFKGPIYNNVID